MASAEHLPAREVAKTVVVFCDNNYYILVVPASRHLRLGEVQYALGLNHVCLATETELMALFPDCELGAMPPIGALYDIPVYAALLPSKRRSLSTVVPIGTPFTCR